MTDTRTRCKPGSLKRLAWLLACIGFGALIGFVGSTWSGNGFWWLAILAAMAVGWLFFADPSQCLPPDRPDDPNRS